MAQNEMHTIKYSLAEFWGPYSSPSSPKKSAGSSAHSRITSTSQLHAADLMGHAKEKHADSIGAGLSTVALHTSKKSKLHPKSKPQQHAPHVVNARRDSGSRFYTGIAELGFAAWA